VFSEDGTGSGQSSKQLQGCDVPSVELRYLRCCVTPSSSSETWALIAVADGGGAERADDDLGSGRGGAIGRELLLSAACVRAALVYRGVAAVAGDAVLHADGGLGLALEQAVDDLDALHERVVGVGDFVLPHAEAAAGIDAAGLEPGDDFGEDVIALDAGCGVGVVGVVAPAGDDVGALAGLEEAGVLEAGDDGFDHGIVVAAFVAGGWLEGGLGDFAEEGVVVVLVGRHVGRVVGEVGDAVEGAVVLGEVHPALGVGGACAGPPTSAALEADADHVAGGVKQALRGSADGVGHFAGEDVAAEDIEGHRADERVVGVGGGVGEGDELLVDIDRDDVLVERDVLGFKFTRAQTERGAEARVELAGAALERELELVVGAPTEVVLFKEDVAQRAIDIEDCDALADPLFVHHLGRVGPDFEVVRAHEVVRDSLAEDGVDELAEVARGRGGGNFALAVLGLDEAGKALVGGLPGEIADVVLEGVWHPAVEHPHPGFAVVEREIGAHQLVEDLVVVGVVAEHDVAADVPGEAGGVGEGMGQATYVGVAVVETEVLVAQLLEAISGT